MKMRRGVARSFDAGSGERIKIGTSLHFEDPPRITAGRFKNGLIIIIFALFSFYLISCSNGPKNEDKRKSAKEIMHDYSENLANAPDKARKAAALEEKRNASQEEAIKELDK